MGKDKNVSTEALRNICIVLDCEVGDIMKFIPDDKKEDWNMKKVSLQDKG